MAEYANSAEAAFLASVRADGDSMQSTSNTTMVQQKLDAEVDEDEDYDPTSFVMDAQSTSPPIASTTGTAHFAEVNEGADARQSVTSGDADLQTPANTTSSTAGPAGLVKKPRKIGGFALDDDDDDENPAPQTAAAGFNGSMIVEQGTTSTPQRSVTQSPTNSFPPAPDPTMQKAAQSTSGHTVAPLQSTDSARVVSADRSPLRSPTVPTAVNAPQVSNGTPAVSASLLPKARLPQDRIGILEDRIAEDPRGDVDAWLSLINEHQRRHKLDDARAVYDRFFKLFPQASEQWVAYAKMELEQEEFYRLEQIFTKTLMVIPSVQLWSLYLDYIRRRQNLATDASGNARRTITQAYELCLKQIGIDKDSGFIWQDYINFLKSGPGVVGGATWQDQQKMDSLRRIYKQAVCVPNQNITSIWSDYGKFENELNKTTARKFLAEKMASFMTAKQAYVELSTKTRKLFRTTLPRLPPAQGYAGDIEFEEQVKLWNTWTQWEKDDPLVLKEEDVASYHARVLYVYKHALMAMRFWPQMWFDAAEFCYANGMEKEGDKFLSDGMEANPESCLLAFRKADRLELSSASDPGTDAVKRGAAVRAPFNAVLDALYTLRKKLEVRSEKAIARIEESFAQESAANEHQIGSEDDEDEDEARTKSRSEAKAAQIKESKAMSAAQIEEVKKTISWTWIALMRAMRRIQGKGKAGDPAGGLRQIFADARKRGQLTGDLFVECGLMEYHCYREAAGTKILEKAAKLYPDDETVALAYIKHLIDLNDMTNARAVFETVVSRYSQDPDKVHKAKPLYLFFHDWESRYGELGQVNKLEKRMADLFAKEEMPDLFAHRFEAVNASRNKFDATSVRLIISPGAQLQPKTLPFIAEPNTMPQSPAQLSVQSSGTPKRRFDQVDSDNELHPPRKLARGESPLKGAAGRRLEARRAPAGPTPLPSGIHFLLQILPSRAACQKLPSLNIPALLDLLRNADLKKAQFPSTSQPAQAPPRSGPPVPPPTASRPNFPPPNMPPAGFPQYSIPPPTFPPPSGGPMQYAFPPPPNAFPSYQQQWNR